MAEASRPMQIPWRGRYDIFGAHTRDESDRLLSIAGTCRPSHHIVVRKNQNVLKTCAVGSPWEIPTRRR
jgi:hypothetical protein